MEGPTPVSALLHAATIVTAGVYVLVRVREFLCEVVVNQGAWLASFTGFAGAFMACAYNDIKKIVAFSTSSQLGYIIAGIFAGVVEFAYFHLLYHGFFKGLLFLAAGLFVHSASGQQDLRSLGGFISSECFSGEFFSVGSSSLLGFSGTSGIRSKEAVIFICIMQVQEEIGRLLYIGSFFTSFYSNALFYFG